MAVVPSSSVSYFIVSVYEELYGSFGFAFWAFCFETFVSSQSFTFILDLMVSWVLKLLIMTIEDHFWVVEKTLTKKEIIKKRRLLNFCSFVELAELRETLFHLNQLKLIKSCIAMMDQDIRKQNLGL